MSFVSHELCIALINFSVFEDRALADCHADLSLTSSIHGMLSIKAAMKRRGFK